MTSVVKCLGPELVSTPTAKFHETKNRTSSETDTRALQKSNLKQNITTLLLPILSDFYHRSFH